MRLYTFTNFYLSSIQQGIQPLHVVGNMAAKYRNETSDKATAFFDWARIHKTVICLNGGAHENIGQIYEQLEQLAFQLELPVSDFHEDHMSLGGIRTSCGIVVPENIYTEAAQMRETGTFASYPVDSIPSQLKPSYELAALISSYGLAK